MRKIFSVLVLLAASLLAPRLATAQNCNNFNLVGTAVPGPAGTGSYRITNSNAPGSNGAIWGNNLIDLSYDFDISYTVNLCGSADGVVFVLQNTGPQATNNNTGGTLGYYTTTGTPTFGQSLAVELDIYSNSNAPFNDPFSPHMMLAQNGNPAGIQGPVLVPTLNDCANHVLRITWVQAARLFTVRLDNVTRFGYVQDLVNNVFGGNPRVWFGFTGTTGAETATQFVTPIRTTRPPVVVDGNRSICQGSSTTLTARSLPAGTVYAWTPATGLNTTSSATVTAAPTASTRYLLTTTPPNGCPDTVSVRVAVLPTSLTTLSPSPTVCLGASATLTATNASAGASFQWAPATGLNTTSGAAVVATPTATTLYTVTTTIPNGCPRQDTVRVRVALPPAITVAPPPLPAPGSVTLTVAGGTAGTTYRWTPSTGLSATTGPVVTANPATPTTYTVTATNATGCTSQATVNVALFALPNVITPNGDRLNDTFYTLVASEPVNLQVFNRWGRQVFEQANYRDGWGADAAAGVYYYLLTSASGGKWKGWVEVVR